MQTRARRKEDEAGGASSSAVPTPPRATLPPLKYEVELDSGWSPYTNDQNTALATASAGGETTVTLTNTSTDEHGSVTWTYEVDLVAHTQRNVDSEKRRRIRVCGLGLPPNTPQQRAALSLLGLSFGDCSGLPFELSVGVDATTTPDGVGEPRAEYNGAPRGGGARRALITRLVRHGCKTGAGDWRRRERTAWVRPYSDDTVCSDLKMSAVAAASWIVTERPAAVELLGGRKAVLQRCVLQQYLKWAHSQDVADDDRGYRMGALFQGWGKFTFDFLIRTPKNAVGQQFSADDEMWSAHPDFGQWWPTKAFAGFGESYFAGNFGFPSWGNGAVMSFAPHPIAAASWWPAADGGVGAHAQVLSDSHREPATQLGAALLLELLLAVYAGDVGGGGGASASGDGGASASASGGGGASGSVGGGSDTKGIRSTLLGLPAWAAIVNASAAGSVNECYPIAAFGEWLAEDDASATTASAFFATLTRQSKETIVVTEEYGVFGALLRAASNWDDDHGLNWVSGLGPKLTRDTPNSREPVLFSQRGLNSVMIAVWCAASCVDPFDALDNVLYVGGDSDTVGAVAGQLACGLLPEATVLDAYYAVVALGEGGGESDESDGSDGSGRGGSGSEPHEQVARAAASRYMERARLYAMGDLEALRATPSLIDVEYPSLTDPTGKTLLPP